MAARADFTRRILRGARTLQSQMTTGLFVIPIVILLYRWESFMVPSNNRSAIRRPRSMKSIKEKKKIQYMLLMYVPQMQTI
jgi:hypothetical protein